MDIAIFVENEALVFLITFGLGNEGLDEIDAEESKEVDEGCYERDDSGKFGKSEDMKRS